MQDNENYFVTEDGILVHNGYNSGSKQKTGGAHEELNFDSATEQRHHMPSQAAGNKGGKGGL